MPRLVPILLVHGFDGVPSHWIESGFRQYLIANGELDPNLVRTFDYGVAEDGTYNNRGDLRQIASRLAGANLLPEERLLCSVDQLSDNSVARGGPPQVTLIAHSLGGIICRYYLSRSTPDQWGTVYRGSVGRLITIGTPHRGVELGRIIDLAPRGSPQWWFVRLLERVGLAPAKPASTVERLAELLQRQQIEQRGPDAPLADGVQPRVLLTDTPIYKQLHPDSPLLADLAKPGMMPSDVRCYTLYGDIRYSVRIRMNRLTLIDHTVSFGDLVVSAASARDIPNVQCTSYPFVEGESLDMTLTTAPAQAEPRSLIDQLPAVSHNRQVANPAFQKAVLGIVVP
jgi:pimeloyl-ACP methyl ester carboxylesterase